MPAPQIYAATAAAFAFAIVGATASGTPSYTRIPFGREVLSHCLHEIPSGARSYAQADGSTRVVAPGGEVSVIPKCDGKGHPVFRFHSLSHDQSVSTTSSNGLPPDYDGWLSYTSLNTTDAGIGAQGFDAFTSTMSVPDVPARAAQVLYFFPGLQNIDWIPKVDPEPTPSNPFDIIQPVLQYPGGFLSRGWALKSWYVTVNAGALFSTAINSIQPGDAILCNMTRTGPQEWLIRGTLKSDPSKSTEQRASNERLKTQPWAYSAVTECYGCDGCSTFPKKPITFTENKLYQKGNLVQVPGSKWHINAKPPVKFECHEKTVVAANGDATTSFQ